MGKAVAEFDGNNTSAVRWANGALLVLLGIVAACASPAEHGIPRVEPKLIVAHRRPIPPSDSFQSLVHESMARMDRGMMSTSTDDPDRDFAAMMIPHHQGAVDMAVLELRYGNDERLRRLAQGIIIEQRQEIVLMEQILAGKTVPVVVESASVVSAKPTLLAARGTVK